jgi:D-glycero-alpha-D-manno-heptose-7-phosphate kinase
MIISRTPYRISFFGGGTDYPSWYRSHGGQVLATSIDKYCYLTCRYLPPFFEHRFRVVYSKIESCQTIGEIQHPSVREILNYLNYEYGLEIHHDGDLPARSGMGSSSSFTVGLMNALYALQGWMPSKEQLAKESIYIEQEMINETVGSQDQVMAAYGGFNHVQFHEHGEFTVNPIVLPIERINDLNDHLMLFYTGIKRTASNVAGSYLNKFEEKKRELQILTDLVDECLSLLKSDNNIKAFGELLHETWQLKRSLSPIISNPELDDLYKKAQKAGAIGGKLTGAGGGGFLLLFVEPEHQPEVMKQLNHLIHVPFNFDMTGSQIIFVDRHEDYLDLHKERLNREILPFREMKQSNT